MSTTRDESRWEQRRYWRDDDIVYVEWWFGQQPASRDPVRTPDPVLRRDFCYRHGTAIYPDLGCQVCGQRPRKLRR